MSLIFGLSLLLIGCDSKLDGEQGLSQEAQIAEPALDSPIDQKPTFTSQGTRFHGALSADGSVEYYLGIPFAEPPVAHMRWMPPVPRLVMPESVQVNEFADACMQGPHLANWYKGVILSFGGDPSIFPVPSVSEDCLYLNIWRPRNAQTPPVNTASIDSSADKNHDANESLPVFVFIHGGSNKGGWSYEPNYIGEELSKRGIIVISIAYRLGAFGFFSHSELEHANFGLLDQVAALKWIQSNIAALGGDPNRITVGGESAGANNIEYLISMPQAKGLFQRAIHQSGGSPMLDRSSKKTALALSQKLYEKLQEDMAVDPLKAVNTLKAVDPLMAVTKIEAMQSVSAERIQAAVEEVYQGYYFDVVVDQKSISKPVSDVANKFELASVDLMIGTNANENLMYLDGNETLENWLSSNAPNASLEKVREVLGPVSSAPGASALQQLDKVSSGRAFTCPSLQFAEGLSKSGGHSWVYYFSKVRAGELAQKMGAYHGAELPYMFGTHDDWLPTDADDRALSETMMAYWVQFIKTGSPNSDSAPIWPEYEQAGDEVQILDQVVRSGQHTSHRLCQELL